jgi:hypothetical protein
MSDTLEISGEIVDLYHANLKSRKDKLDWIMKEKGLLLKTIDKYLIGYDPMLDRYTIPIKDAMDNYANIRKYKKDSKAKMISYVDEKEKNLPADKRTSYGQTRIWPIENIRNNKPKVIFCEGEWDCLLLLQNGFNAITKTAGVNTWRDEWNKWFKGKDVIFIYDCQPVSRGAAEQHKDKIMQEANSIKIIDLGLGDHGEDIGDWYLKNKRDTKQLAELIRKSSVRDIYELIDLSTSLDSAYYNQKVKFHGIVVGKDLSPYIIPKEITAHCNTGQREGSKICVICPLAAGDKTAKYTYESDKEILVKMINANDKQIQGVLRQNLQLPAGRFCPGAYDIEVKTRQNIEEISIIPEINHEVIDQEYVIRNCYFFGQNIKLNQGYLLKGTTWADPNSQMGVHLITHAKEAQDSVSKFELTDQIKKELAIFKPKSDKQDDIQDKFEDLYRDFTYNVTRMYERQNLIMAIDLVYHSVINFKFLGRTIKKGWLECAIVGDTKCGKSETAETILRHYRAGEFITSGEHTSRAGLLGGEQQTKRGSWNVTWGKLVMNNKGLIILDEADELSRKGIIGQLSGVRSTGIAELVQIQSQKAMAKTRIIWISNPLSYRMSEHNYGVEVIRELFQTQQDISRIDFAVAAAGEDVSDELINKKHKETYPHKYKSQACHHSVMFAWSRTADQVRFTQKAEELILKLATDFGNMYYPDIPLVIGAEMRIKIARLAVSIAARLNSVDKTGEIVEVKEGHVLCAAEYLHINYDNKVMGYKDYSDQRKRETEIGDTEKVDALLVDEEVISMLLDSSKFQLRDLEDIFNLSKGATSELIAYMRKNRIIRRVHTFYVKTPAFIYHLKKKRTALKEGTTKNISEDIQQASDFFDEGGEE